MWRPLRFPRPGKFLQAEGASRTRLRIVLQPSTLRHKFRLYTGFTTGRPLAVPYEDLEWGHFLRAEGYSRRCGQFEFVTAQRHLSPRRSAACKSKSNLSGPSGHLSYKARLITNTLLCVSGRRRWCAKLGRCRTRRSSCGRTKCPSGRVLHRSCRCGRWSATCR